MPLTSNPVQKAYQFHRSMKTVSKRVVNETRRKPGNAAKRSGKGLHKTLARDGLVQCVGWGDSGSCEPFMLWQSDSHDGIDVPALGGFFAALIQRGNDDFVN